MAWVVRRDSLYPYLGQYPVITSLPWEKERRRALAFGRLDEAEEAANHMRDVEKDVSARVEEVA